METPKRKAFNFYKSYFDVYNELPNKDKLLFIDALLNRQFYGIEPSNLKGIVNFAYLSQKHSIDKQVEGFESKTKTKLQGGSVGGAQGGSVQEKEEEKEKGKGEYTLKEKIDYFLNFFNQTKKQFTGKEGKFKMLSSTDLNNFKKLIDVYTFKDFNEAIPNLFKNDWAVSTNNLTPTHFLRNDNFNKYLNYEATKKSGFAWD